MWSGFEKFNAKLDNSNQNETIDHISTIAGSLASIETEHTESPVSQFFFFFFIFINSIKSAKQPGVRINFQWKHFSIIIPLFDFINFLFLFIYKQGLDDRVYDTDHTDLNSDFDESELRRELLQDVSKNVINNIFFSFKLISTKYRSHFV